MTERETHRPPKRINPMIMMCRQLAAIFVLAFSVIGCDDGNPGSPPATTMAGAAAPAGMSKYAYLAADGGPHMLLPADVASAWPGASVVAVLDSKSDYGHACAARGPSGIASITFGSGSALILSDPPMTAWGIAADGSVEIYKLTAWTNTNLDALIGRAIAALPTSSLTNTGLKLHLESPDAFLLFAGDTPTSTAYGVHRIPLAPGTYSVLSGSYAGPGESLMIYRLKLSGK